MTQNNVILKEIIDEDIDKAQNIKRTKIVFADTELKNVPHESLLNTINNTNDSKKYVYKVHHKGEVIIIHFKSIKNNGKEEQIVEFEPVEKPSSKNTASVKSVYSTNPIFKEIMAQNISKKHSSSVTKSPRLARILFFGSSYLLSLLAYLMFDSPLNYIAATILAGYSTTMLFQFLRKRHS